MKQRIILILLALIATLTSYGQMPSRISTVPCNGVLSLVRQDPATGKHVTYSRPLGTEAHFALSDNTQMLDVKVADNIRITDFEIIDGMVFFCGDDYTCNSGLLGWFDINKLFYYNVPVHIDATLSAMGLASLDNIEVYHSASGNEIHVAGYGRRPSESKTDMVFEAVGLPTTGMSYRTMKITPSSGLDVDIVDMAITDNYAVFLSQVITDEPLSYGIGVELYPFPKYAMFDTPPFTSDFFQFAAVDYCPCHLQLYRLNNDPVYSPCIVHNIGDKVSVCSHNITNNVTDPHAPSSSSGELAFRTFDLSPLSLSSPITMTAAHYIELPKPNLGDIVDLLYDRGQDCYLVFHQHEAAMGYQEYGVTHINLIGGTFPATVESEYTQPFDSYLGWIPYDICIDSGNRFTSVGRDLSSNKYVFWKGNSVASTPNCVIQQLYTTTPIPTVVSKNNGYTEKPSVWKILVFHNRPIHPIHRHPIEIICN